MEKRSGNLEGSGKFIGLQVIKKNISGAVTGMEIVTENKSIQLEGEYEIRQFLSPAGCLITEKDGSIVNGSNLLPSAYFELNVKSGKAVQIQGKGYGHGVGMSQNGANEMAREGYVWQDILNYFFKDITLEVVGNNLSKRET